MAFLQWGDKALHFVYAVFNCGGISMSCIDKLCNFYSCTLFHKLRDFTIKLVSMDKEDPLKMCLRNSACGPFSMNNSDQIFLVLYQKMSDWNFSFLAECIILT